MSREVDFVVGGAVATGGQPGGGAPAPAMAQRRTLAAGAVVLVAAALVARSVTGHGDDRSPAGCPSDATCSIVSGLPDPGRNALVRAFPGSHLIVGSSVLAQRPGRFGPDLVSRTFRARAGSTDITVHIVKPAAGAPPTNTSDRRFGRVRTITSLEQTVPGFVVAVDVSQPAGSWPIAYEYLVQLANDDGLVAAQ